MNKYQKRPDFFIVGAPKSGTTAMTFYLRQHPEIFIPPRKEVHFFGSDLTKIPHDFIILDQKRYLNLFTPASREKRIGESSVMYLYSQKAPREIREFNEDAQIIIMLRNPVEVMHAAHGHNYWGAYENTEDFATALELEKERRKGIGIPHTCMIHQTLFYRELGRYSSHVRRWFDLFGRNKVRVIIFDDFVKDTQRIYREICSFLDVDKNFIPRFKKVNSSKKVRIWQIMAWIQRPPIPLFIMLKLMPERLRLLFVAAVSRFNSKFQRRDPIDSDLRRKLLNELRPDIEELSKLLGKSLNHWVISNDPGRKKPKEFLNDQARLLT